MTNTHCKYLIVGGGLSGKIMALGLASNNIKSTIVERTNNAQYHDTRTIALNSHAVKTLNQYNLWGTLKPFVSNIKDIYVVDDKDDLHMLHFTAKAQDTDNAVGHMIESADFNRALNEAVVNSPLISQIQAEYTDIIVEKHTTLILKNNNTITADLVIAADGKRSGIAQKFFTKSIVKEYDHGAITFKIAHTKPHQGTAIEHFMPSGPFAVLPLRNPLQSSIVWCDKLETLKFYTTVPAEELSLHLLERIGPILGDVQLLSPLSSKHCFPLDACMTSEYFYKNIVLIADAAHSVHPLAGQGLNQGIKDISALVSIIQNQEYCGLETDSVALAKYQDQRKLDNYLMYLLTDKLSLIFSNNIPIAKFLRRTGLSLLDSIEPIKKYMAEYATGIKK